MQIRLIVKLTVGTFFTLAALSPDAHRWSLALLNGGHESTFAAAAEQCTGKGAEQCREVSTEPSEAEELQTALRSNNIDALQTYLEKYPETGKRAELMGIISRLKRAELNEWTLYEIDGQRLPQFMKLSSIRPSGDKVAAETKFLIDSSAPGRKFPEGSYRESLVVFHCIRPIMAVAESRVVDPTGKVLYAYKWADPMLLDLSTASPFPPGSTAASAQRLLCDERLRTPLVRKQDLANMKFISLPGATPGGGEMFYKAIDGGTNNDRQREIAVIRKFNDDRDLNLGGRTVSEFPRYRTDVSAVRMNCADGTTVEIKSEYYDTAHNLIYLDTHPNEAKEMSPDSPFAVARRVACNFSERNK